MTPQEIQQMMALQMLLSQQSQQPAPQQAPQQAAPQPITAAPPIPSGNPLLAGNDGLRQQFYDHPELAPTNDANWLDERQAHILGQDAPPSITVSAPPSPPAGPPMMAPNPPAQTIPQAPAPQPPISPPMLSGAPVAPPAAPSAPMLPQAAQITQLPQQAPVMSQVSPAPKVDAKANIDNSVTMPTQTFTPAYQPPPLPQFMNASLIPNLGGYKPAPMMPGYAQPRSGSPFMGRPAAASAPQLPSFDNPFAAPQFGGAGGLTAGGPSSMAGIAQQQPYDNSLYGQFLMPRLTPQF